MPVIVDPAALRCYAAFPAEVDRDWWGRVCHLNEADLRAARMLPDVRFAHEDAVAGAHEPAFGERLGRRVGGLIVRLSPPCERCLLALGGAKTVLPRRFRSSALVRLRCGSACHRTTRRAPVVGTPVRRHVVVAH